MRESTRVRKPRVDWPDQRRFEDEFAARLLNDEKAKVRRLMADGCLWGNLMSFLYAYTFWSTTVLREHSRRRDVALEGLKAIADRLDRACSQK